MFLDWKNQYCENECTTESDLQIQYNPCQITSAIFRRTRTKNFTICMETQKTSNIQGKPYQSTNSIFYITRTEIFTICMET